MEQGEFANYTDAQLEALRDDLGGRHARRLQLVGGLVPAFAVVSLVALRLVPIEILILAPLVFPVVGMALLVSAIGMASRRLGIIRELDSRGAVQAAICPADEELNSSALRAIRVPGIGLVVSVLLLLSLTAVIVITDAPDGSPLFTAAFVSFAPCGAFLVWLLVILAHEGKLRIGYKRP